LRKKSKRTGSKKEEYIRNQLMEALPGIQETANSGARFGDADLSNKDWVIEVKSTVKTSYRIEKALLQKTVDTALLRNKQPAIVVMLSAETPEEDNCFVILPLRTAITLMKNSEVM